MRYTPVLIAALALAACAAAGRVYPLNDVASAGPMPVISFVKQGLGRGPITVTLADGTVLHGEYQVTENAALGFGFSGRYSATAVGFGSGRHVVASAYGADHRMNCEGVIDTGGHGSLICESETGADYRVLV